MGRLTARRRERLPASPRPRTRPRRSSRTSSWRSPTSRASRSRDKPKNAYGLTVQVGRRPASSSATSPPSWRRRRSAVREAPASSCSARSAATRSRRSTTASPATALARRRSNQQVQGPHRLLGRLRPSPTRRSARRLALSTSRRARRRCSRSRAAAASARSRLRSRRRCGASASTPTRLYLGPHILTSGVKRVDTAVYTSLRGSRRQASSRPAGTYVFNLKNGGVRTSARSAKACRSGFIAKMNARSRSSSRARSSLRRRSSSSRASSRGRALPAPSFLATRSSHESRPDGRRSRPVLELRGITKRFPGIVANDHDRLRPPARGGPRAAGRERRGKSTLMNVLYGLYRPDEGEILVNGQPVTMHSAQDAIQHGIGMVHQHFMLIPVMTVAENIVLGTEPTRAGVFLDHGAAERRVRELAQSFGFAIDPDARIAGHHGRPAAARRDPEGALPQRGHPHPRRADRGADAAGGDASSSRSSKALTREGMSVIFISHKLNEVLEIADRITVLRRGKLIETLPREGATEQGLARSMVGREVLLRRSRRRRRARARRSSRSRTSRSTTTAVSRRYAASRFNVRAGEIVGIAGVDGNGQTELVEALTGLRRATAAGCGWRDEEITIAAARETARRRARPHPGGSPAAGLVLDFSLAENLALHDYRHEPNSRFGWLRPEPARRPARAAHRASSTSAAAARRRRHAALSGGNQQKVVVAREVARDPSVLIAAQPTRGLDVGAIEFVHRRLVEERDDGRAVSARLPRARGDPLALRSHPRHLRGADRRRVRPDVRRRARASR